MAIHKFKDIHNNVFSNSPKVWYKYIEMIIHRNLNITDLQNKNCRYLLLQIIHSATLFEKLKNKLVKLEGSVCVSEHLSHRDYRPITMLSGQFASYLKTFEPHCYLYFLKPYPLFKIKFKFNLIFILSGELEIKNSSGVGFIFYGYHSNFTLYPGFKNVNITIKVSNIDININGSFSAVDKGIIYSFSVTKYATTTTYHAYLINYGFVWHSYFLQVGKFYQIIVDTLDMKNNEYFIVEGPGILSDTLKNQPVVKYSTFQCIIYLLHEDNTHFKFHSKLLQCSEIHQISKGKVISTYLPDGRCLSNKCILYATTEYDHINVSVVKITTTNWFDPLCVFCGLVAAENIKYDYRQSDTLCKNYNATKDPSRSFYSHNSALALILYWYKRYGLINVTLNIFKTKCKVVYIDVCNKYTKAHNFCGWNSNCQSYLNYTIQYSGVYMSHHRRPAVGDHLNFTDPKGTRIIFLLLSNVSIIHGRYHSCSFVDIYFKMNEIYAIKGSSCKGSKYKFRGIDCNNVPSSQIKSQQYNIQKFNINTYNERKKTIYYGLQIHEKPQFHVLEIRVEMFNTYNCWLENILFKQSKVITSFAQDYPIYGNNRVHNLFFSIIKSLVGTKSNLY